MANFSAQEGDAFGFKRPQISLNVITPKSSYANEIANDVKKQVDASHEDILKFIIELPQYKNLPDHTNSRPANIYSIPSLERIRDIALEHFKEQKGGFLGPPPYPERSFARKLSEEIAKELDDENTSEEILEFILNSPEYSKMNLRYEYKKSKIFPGNVWLPADANKQKKKRVEDAVRKHYDLMKGGEVAQLLTMSASSPSFPPGFVSHMRNAMNKNRVPKELVLTEAAHVVAAGTRRGQPDSVRKYIESLPEYKKAPKTMPTYGANGAIRLKSSLETKALYHLSQQNGGAVTVDSILERLQRVMK